MLISIYNKSTGLAGFGIIIVSISGETRKENFRRKSSWERRWGLCIAAAEVPKSADHLNCDKFNLLGANALFAKALQGKKRATVDGEQIRKWMSF